MDAKTEQLIDTGLAHLGRFAFFRRDNPYLSSRASLGLPRAQRATIGNLLDERITVSDWLETEQAQDLLQRVRVGCVPRDVQLVTRDGQTQVAAGSVHAFLHAPVFWWLLSILWCISIGRRADQMLPDTVKGYRLHPGFVKNPMESGTMFRNSVESYNRWQDFVSTIASQFPHQVLVASTLDVKDFYYSVRAQPSDIVASFARSRKRRLLVGRHRILTQLLDLLHARYAERSRLLRPRPSTDAHGEGRPLPVGAPSSQILANLVICRALDDLAAIPAIDAVAVYADDFVFVTRSLPDTSEPTKAYLSRLGVLDPKHARLRSPTAEQFATLRVQLEKSSTFYMRSTDAAEKTAEQVQVVDGDLDPYIEGHPGAEWGGRLRTVLRAPYKRDRIPKELRSDIGRLVDELRMGLDAEEARERVRTLVEELDAGLFLSLRPYWTDLIVAWIGAFGPAGVETLTAEFSSVANALEPPPDTTPLLRQELYSGLRASWVQALAQALAVSLSAEERDLLPLQVPLLIEDHPRMRDLSTRRVVEYAQRIRRRRLISDSFVSVPLSEFTGWDGRLIGHDIFSEFTAWTASTTSDSRTARLRENVSRAVRFIPLHEVCLAFHLWVQPDSGEWLEDCFSVLSSQPLVQRDALDDLQTRAASMLAPCSTEACNAIAEPTPMRIGLPSMPIWEDQLSATIEGDAVALGNNARISRKATATVVLTAASRDVDVLVLPEWSLLPQQLPWLMNQARRAQMLVVGGQSATIHGNRYSNAIWIGLPFTDAVGHTACLVPQPREKKFLSPAERSALAIAGLIQSPSQVQVPSYMWKGMRIASLVCFEFADIATRESLRDSADLLTVSSLNRDWRYFDAIQDATTRDNYCITVCVNTGRYPGTRLMRPTSSEKAVVASVHGSEQASLISRTIDVTPVVAARIHKQHPKDCLDFEPSDDTCLADYKPFPPY